MPTPNDIYSRTVRVPILMYHYIRIPPEGADEYGVDLSVSPDAFRAQMEYLVANGYTTVDLYDITLAIVNQRELPPKPVVITVDDGYRDFYDSAFPVLKELGLKATLFVITDYVDRSEPNYVSWAMVAEMAQAGIRIEPHSKSHVNLNGRDRDFLIWEMLGSQETVAAHIGYTPRYFAYPGGRYDELAMEVLEDLGFWGSVTTYGGTWHGYMERFEWTRMRVRYTTTMPVFVDILEE
jgi:peptidoglycan/xylan/chitin deacetylase (PgdA/CDA1 family)